jgi:hypothetical protein
MEIPTTICEAGSCDHTAASRRSRRSVAQSVANSFITWALSKFSSNHAFSLPISLHALKHSLRKKFDDELWL